MRGRLGSKHPLPLASPRRPNMTNSCFSLNGGRSTCFPADYQTDLIASKAGGQIE